MNLQTIGWIGTGVMGNAMCGHLLDKGHSVFVHNRSRSKAEALISRGAKWRPDPKSVAEESEVIFTMVGYPSDVEEAVLGPNGLLSGAVAGKIYVDMTTSTPSLAVRIAREAAAKNVGALDAPVSGGDVGAKTATLAIMAGGEKIVFEAVLPLFRHLGETIAHMGAAGMGQHTKMCNQILIASTMIGTVESILYAARAGLDPGAVIDVIGKGAASSWSINNLGRRIAVGNFDPGFYIRHFVKDMGIALEEARRMNLALPGLALVNQFYVSAMAMGFENLGTQALYKVLERMNENLEPSVQDSR
jgi:3-hydroxyisobutyrate dehydrogenase